MRSNSNHKLSAVLFILSLNLLFIGAAWSEGLPRAFNGKDFSGWQVPENNIWWQVADGVVIATSDEKRTGSILWTKHEYKNFIIEFDYKNGFGTVDTGVFLRTDKEQIQIGMSGSLKRDMTGSPYIAGKGYPVEAKGVADLLKKDTWNSMTIVAKGDSYSVWLNGGFVLNYTSETAIHKGPIGLQLHPNNEMSIHFRRIRIAELD